MAVVLELMGLFLHIVQKAVLFGVVVAGIAALVTATTMRSDAFEAADRKPKTTWLALLFGAEAALIILGAAYGSLLAQVVGFVIIGIYWFDVYPNLKDLVSGSESW